MIATIINQGKTRWMIIDEVSNSDKLIEFLEALIKRCGEESVLILDNLRVPHSKPVKKWAGEYKEKIELFDINNGKQPGVGSVLNVEHAK